MLCELFLGSIGFFVLIFIILSILNRLQISLHNKKIKALEDLTTKLLSDLIEANRINKIQAEYLVVLQGDIDNLYKVHLQSFLKNEENGIIISNNQGIILQVNKQICRWLGYTPEELIGHTLQFIMPLRFREQHASVFAETVKSHKAVQRDNLPLYMLNKDGHETACFVSLVSFAQGTKMNYIGSISLRNEIP